MRKNWIARNLSNARHSPKTLADILKAGFFMGEIKPGDKMPPLAQAARDWNQSSASIQRAYKLLEAESFLVDTDDRGVLPRWKVNDSIKPPDEKQRQAKLDQLVAKTLAQARKLGYTTDEFDAALRKVIEGLNEKFRIELPAQPGKQTRGH